MKLPNLTAVLASIASLVLLLLYIRTRDDLFTAQASLDPLKRANEEMSARLAQLDRDKVDEAMLKRLLADQREAIKLRGEVANLKKALAAAESAVAAANAAAQKSNLAKQDAPAAQNPEEKANPYTRVLNRKFTANVGLGHAVVFGGWQSAPGKQTFALATPSHDPANGESVTVHAKWFEISDEAMSKLDTAMLLRASGQQSTLTPEQLAAFVKSIEETPGANVLSAPGVSVFSGRQARVSMSQQRSAPDGSLVELGPSMDLVPTLAADGTTVDLAVDAKLTLPTDQLPAPKE